MRTYGPVPSRRFGLSLGIDLVPHKTCSFDCIYCQLGPTDTLSATPSNHFDLDDILIEVEEALADEPRPDVITLAGSGDPTLYSPLAELMDGLKELADIPLLMITNSALFWREEVARAAARADILAPSLDAGDPATFARVNQPHRDVTFDRLVQGLRDVTASHPGEVRLEVMLVRDVNDDEASLAAIARILETLRYDRIDVNTPVRPPVPERGALPCDADVLDRALAIFGPLAHPIGSFERRTDVRSSRGRAFDDRDKDIRQMLLRRPCTREDIAVSLGMRRQDVIAALERLTAAGLIAARAGESGIYYHVVGKNPTILR